jgi:acetate kinase
VVFYQRRPFTRLRIELDDKRNAANEGVISAAASGVVVRAIRTDEEYTIARTVCRVLGLETVLESHPGSEA